MVWGDAELVFDVVAIMGELSSTIPDLPGARCKGQSRLYDRTIGALRGPRQLTEMARKQALPTCSICPVLAQCRTWYDSLPASERPAGVVAGVLNTRPLPG